ncbi:MAG: hypothetical protein Q7S83_00620 [bacterium]|nr:hypothetical protein [bacterium]
MNPEEQPMKVSGMAMIAAMMMVFGGIIWIAGLTMAVIGDRPAWVLSIFLIGGTSLMIVGGIFHHNLTMTEEEGKLPTPPPAGQENGCEEDPGHC